MDLQELITRGRHVMGTAPARREVFGLVNGRRTAQDIATETARHVNSVRRDLNALRDAGLIQRVADGDGHIVTDNRFPLYEKVPLARTVSMKHFRPSAKRPREAKATSAGAGGSRARRKPRKPEPLPMPDADGVLQICQEGESQIYEFKGQGTDVSRVVKEIAGMLNTQAGGLILYGVDDNGRVQGAGVSRQKFDQTLQNSVRSRIAPPATVSLRSVRVMGSEVLLIVVPPWDRKNVFHFDHRVYIRRGTNTVPAKAAESKRLHAGQVVV